MLTKLEPYKLRPAPDDLPDRWMTGTQNHEGIAGVMAAVESLADLGRSVDAEAASRPAALRAAFESLRKYQRGRRPLSRLP